MRNPPFDSLVWGSLRLTSINQLAFSVSQNCQLTSLGSVSCPMGGLGCVDSHEPH